MRAVFFLLLLSLLFLVQSAPTSNHNSPQRQVQTDPAADDAHLHTTVSDDSDEGSLAAAQVPKDGDGDGDDDDDDDSNDTTENSTDSSSTTTSSPAASPSPTPMKTPAEASPSATPESQELPAKASPTPSQTPALPSPSPTESSEGSPLVSKPTTKPQPKAASNGGVSIAGSSFSVLALVAICAAVIVPALIIMVVMRRRNQGFSSMPQTSVDPSTYRPQQFSLNDQ